MKRSAATPSARGDVVDAKLVDWATHQKVGPASAKLVLIHLAGLVDADFDCAVSVRRLADQTALGISTVRRSLQLLERAGLITRREQVGDAGSQLVNRYRVNRSESRSASKPTERNIVIADALPLELELGLTPLKTTGAPLNRRRSSARSRRGALSF